MAITPENPNAIPEPTAISGETGGGVNTPASVSPETDSGISTPVSVTPKTDSGISTPSSVTPELSGEVIAPTSVSSQAAGGPVAPSALSPLAPAGINRTLSPLFNFNSDLPLPDSLTYSRGSSATYLEQYTDPLGRHAVRLSNDYVGSVENLTFYSDTFDNSSWDRGTNSIDPQIDYTNKSPINNVPSYKFVEDSALNIVKTLSSNVITVPNGVNVTHSALVKAGTISKIALYDNVKLTGILFDIKNQSIVQKIGTITGSIVYVSNGWYRLSVTFLTTSTTARLRFYVDSFSTYTRTGNFINVANAQTTVSSKPLPYVKTLDTAVTKTFTASPRVETLGLLTEGSTTNEFVNSEDLFFNWSKVNTTVTQNAELAPDQTFSADRIFDTAVSGSHYTTITLPIVAGNNTVSIYVKSGSLSQFGMAVFYDSTSAQALFDLITHGASGIVNCIPRIEDVADGWKRVSVSFVATTTNTKTIELRLAKGGNRVYDGDANGYVNVWGIQLERLPFASSYIRTELSAVSRGRDIVEATETRVEKNATILLDGSYTAGADSGADGGRLLFSFDDGTGANRYVFINAGGVANAFQSRVGGVIQNSATSGILDTVETSTVVAVSISQNETNFYYSGSLVSTQSTNSQPLASQLIIGSGLGGGSQAYGHIKRIELYDLALTANEVKAL